MFDEEKILAINCRRNNVSELQRIPINSGMNNSNFLIIYIEHFVATMCACINYKKEICIQLHAHRWRKFRGFFFKIGTIITIHFIQSYSIEVKNEMNVIIHCPFHLYWKCWRYTIAMKYLLSIKNFYLNQNIYWASIVQISISQFNSVRKKTENPSSTSSLLL